MQPIASLSSFRFSFMVQSPSPEPPTCSFSLSLVYKTQPLRHHLHLRTGNYETQFTWQSPQKTTLELLPGRACSAPRKSSPLEQESPTEIKTRIEKTFIPSSKFSQGAQRSKDNSP